MPCFNQPGISLHFTSNYNFFFWMNRSKNISDKYEIMDIDYRPSIILNTTRIENYNPETINDSIESVLNLMN